jgi:hypothetical protein
MAGLQILSCDGCGVCCMHMSTPPYIDEIAEKPEDVQSEYWAILETQVLVWKAHGIDAKPCGFFDLATSVRSLARQVHRVASVGHALVFVPILIPRT